MCELNPSNSIPFVTEGLRSGEISNKLHGAGPESAEKHHRKETLLPGIHTRLIRQCLFVIREKSLCVFFVFNFNYTFVAHLDEVTGALWLYLKLLRMLSA